jgi:hypothetical protein
MVSAGIDPLNCSPAEYLQYLKAQTSDPPPSESQLKEEAGFAREMRQKLVEAWGEEDVAEAEKAWPEVAAAPQAERFDAMMAAHARELLEVRPLDIKQDVAFGSLPIGEINAITIQVPAGGSLIVVGQDCFLLIYLLAKAVSSFFLETEDSEGGDKPSFSTDEHRLRDQLECNRLGLMRFTDALLAYQAIGDAFRARPYLQEGPQRAITNQLTSTAEKFIIANELAHLVLGHSDGGRTTQERRLGSQTVVNQVIRNPNEEYAADMVALNHILVYHSHKGFDPAMSYWGVEFLLACLQVLEQVAGERSSGNYPPAAGRRALLRRYIGDTWPDHAGAMFDLGSRTEWLVAAIWEKCAPRFYDLAADYNRIR